MRKTKVFIISLFVLAVVALAVYISVKVFKPKVSGLKVITNPVSTVYINGEQKGRTPCCEGTFTPGEIVLRLIPDTFEVPLQPYDTKINLVGGVETVVKYNFATETAKSSGEIISFEKNPGGETSIVVVSIPDFVNVIIDGRERSTTPFKTSSVAPGNHSVSLFAEGYETLDTQIKTHEGYKLTLIVKLAKGVDTKPQVEEQPKEKAENLPKTEVEILPTTVGYLRVRINPSTTSDEVGRVDPGKRYVWIETDTITGWFKIEFNDGEEIKSGWVSNQYAKKIENETAAKSASSSASLTASPSTTPRPTLTE